MRFSINFGGLLGFLFGHGKRIKEIHSSKNNVEWPDLTPDDVLNCCEQVGAFTEAGVEENGSVVKAVCEAIAKNFNALPKNEANLLKAFNQGFSENSLKVSHRTATTFVSAYLESYVYEQ